MPRYIDADELISWIVNEPSKVGDKDIPLNNEYDGSAFRQIEILGHIESMPTADVVEVVRCKDCAYKQYYFTNDMVKCGCGNGAHHEGFFCADGERRTDDDRNG